MDKPISYKGSEPYIFISYAHKDSDAVWPIIARMQGVGYRVWYDDGIDPGTEWDENIANHVEGCGYFIAFLSPAYLESENCRDELNFARDLGKERLLIYLSDVTLPAGMRMRLSRLQAIHWYTYENEDKAFSKLYEAPGLDTCRGKADQTSAPPPKAPAANPDAANAKALYRKGKEYEETKDSSTAFSYYLKSAQMGYAPAQFAVGSSYERGAGVPQNKAEVVRWYRKAAEQGNADAQFNLGVMYSNGNGVPKNKEEAARWFRKAAAQGDAGAQFNLGVLYSNGDGVPQNKEEAVRWYRKAAEQGNAKAQNNLGAMYYHGDGVPQNKAEAVRWCRKAAEQGNADAQFNLGVMYTNGDGVPKNKEEAARWFRKAAEQGQADAQYYLGREYYYAKGMFKSKQIARQWLQKAADQGHGKAKAFLSEHF